MSRERNPDTERIARVAGWYDARIAGLKDFLPMVAGWTILDIGCNRGTVAFEFARHKAALIHGCDSYALGVETAREIFKEIETETLFAEVDLAGGPEGLGIAFGSNYRDVYDVVLFLGVYHHLKRQMPAGKLSELVRHLAERADRYFVCRTPMLDEVGSIVEAIGFTRVHFSKLHSVSAVAIWQRPELCRLRGQASDQSPRHGAIRLLMTIEGQHPSPSQSNFESVNVRPEIPEQRTLVIVGVPRGGTSLVASAVAHLGIPFDCNPPNYDNREFADAVRAGGAAALVEPLKTMNEKYVVWAWKFGGPTVHLRPCIEALRNPFVVVVIKNPIAAARRKQTMGMRGYEHALAGTMKVLKHYTERVQAIWNVQHPLLLVPYEAAQQTMDEFLVELAKFIGVSGQLSGDRIAALRDAIAADHEHYLRRVAARSHS